MLSTFVWSEAETIQLKSRRKIKKGSFSFLECGMRCDTNMPCNAYHFDLGNCSLAFLKRELFYNVQDQDEENKSIYINGKYHFALL